MGTTGVRFTTAMTVRQAADTFRAAATESQGIGSKTGGLFAKMAGNGGDLEFFTPRDDSPFAGLEEDGEDFGVGVHIPKFTSGGKGAVRTMQMFVWDRGGLREVILVSPHAMTEGMGARKLVQSFLASFSRRDPQLRLTDDRDEDVPAAATPAGWYPDPHGRHEHRYWDGQAWTGHVSDQGQPGLDP